MTAKITGALIVIVAVLVLLLLAVAWSTTATVVRPPASATPKTHPYPDPMYGGPGSWKP